MKFILGAAFICVLSSCNLLGQEAEPNRNNASNNERHASNNHSTSNNKTTPTNNQTTPTVGRTTTGTTASFKIPFSGLLTSKRSTEGLVSQWHFDDLTDKVGNLDLTLQESGGASRTTLLDPHGLHLDGGAATHLDAGDLSSELRSANAFTIELWLQPNRVLQDDAMVVGLLGPDGRNFSLSQQGDTAIIKLRTDDASLYYDRSRGDEPLEIADAFRARLSHWVWTYDGIHTELWIDGVSRGALPIPGGLITWETDFDFVIGSGRDANFWQGDIFYASVYNRALHPREIQHHLSLGEGIDPETPTQPEDVVVQTCELWPFDLLTPEDFSLFSDAGCTSVEGTVRVPTALDNLDYLTFLEHISGDLIIENTSLSTLEGLDNLISIEGRLLVIRNMNLETLTGLSALQTLGDDLRVTDNPLINAVDLIKIDSLPGHFILKNNPNLTSSNLLSRVQTIGGSLVLDELERLTSIFLPELRSAKVISFSRLPIGEIQMRTLQNVEKIRLHELPDLTTFDSPVEPETFNVVRNASLQNLEGFGGNLRTSFNIAYNPSLSRLGMKATELNQIIIIENNLSTLDLTALTKLGANFDLSESAIQSLDGALPQLTSTQDIVFWRNASLSSMDGAFPKLERTRSLSVLYNSALPELSKSFSMLETADWISIENNETLAQCDVDILLARFTNLPSVSTMNNGGVDNCLAN